MTTFFPLKLYFVVVIVGIADGAVFIIFVVVVVAVVEAVTKEITNSSPFTDPEGLFSYSNDPTADSYFEPICFSHVKSIFILVFHLSHGL